MESIKVSNLIRLKSTNPPSSLYTKSLATAGLFVCLGKIVKSELAKKIFLTKSLHNSKKCTTFAVEKI